MPTDTEEENVSGKVLVVDDEVNIVELLVGWLETIGCDVIQANNGAQAIDQAREHHPDLILMDCMMPEVSGFDACQKLKADPNLKDIPVIFLTVRNEVQDVVTGLELGAHGYMTKPFKPQELLARVRSVLRIKKIQDRLRTKTKALRSEWSWVNEVLTELPAGVLVIDDEDQVVFFNQLVAVKTGTAEAQGRPWQEVFEFDGLADEGVSRCKFGPKGGDLVEVEARVRINQGTGFQGRSYLLVFS